jgi:hypothetical protein
VEESCRPRPVRRVLIPGKRCHPSRGTTARLGWPSRLGASWTASTKPNWVPRDSRSDALWLGLARDFWKISGLRGKWRVSQPGATGRSEKSFLITVQSLRVRNAQASSALTKAHIWDISKIGRQLFGSDSGGNPSVPPVPPLTERDGTEGRSVAKRQRRSTEPALRPAPEVALVPIWYPA